MCIAINELQFGKVIGRGAFGVVHKGLWNKQEVALKKIPLPPGIDAMSLPTPNEIAVLKYRISLNNGPGVYYLYSLPAPGV